MLIYDLIILIFSPIIFFTLIFKFKKRKMIIFERFFLKKNFPPSNYILFQAASIGEVKIASVLAKKIKEKKIFKTVLSTQTYEGLKEGKNFDYKIIAPVDISIITNSFIRKIQPKISIFLETEIWPNLISSLKKRNCKIFLVNARISEKTFPYYKIISKIFPSLFSSFQVVFSKSPQDKKRFEKLGSKNIKVIRNLKYDMVKEEIEDLDEIKRFNKKVILWGSMREGEEEIAIKVFKNLKRDFKDFLFIYVPRHIEKTPEIIEKLKKEEINFSLWENESDFIIVNKTGILLPLYRISDVAIVGGSFLPYGGQNLLEPAFLGKPVITGKHYWNFKDIVEEIKDFIFIVDNNEIYDKIKLLLEDENLRIESGKRLKEEVMKRTGMIETIIDEILKYA